LARHYLGAARVTEVRPQSSDAMEGQNRADVITHRRAHHEGEFKEASV